MSKPDRRLVTNRRKISTGGVIEWDDKDDWTDIQSRKSVKIAPSKIVYDSVSYEDLSKSKHHWRLSETSGSTAEDYAGSADGSYTSDVSLGATTGPDGEATPVFGTSGTALVELPRKMIKEYEEQFSLSIWFKCTDVTGYNPLYTVTGTTSGNEWSPLRIAIKKGQLYVDYEDYILDKIGSVPENEFVHIGMYVDYFSNTTEVFINGASEAEAPGVTTPTSINNVPHLIGYDRNNDTGFPGAIADVRLWPRTALTPSEINTLYRLGPTAGY